MPPDIVLVRISSFAIGRCQQETGICQRTLNHRIAIFQCLGVETSKCGSHFSQIYIGDVHDAPRPREVGVLIFARLESRRSEPLGFWKTWLDCRAFLGECLHSPNPLRSLHNTSYAKLNYGKKLARIFAFVAIALLAAGPALAQNASPAAGAQVATDPAKDAALKTYLQKHFKIPSAEFVTLGPAFKTPITGLLARQLTVKNDQGQSITAMIFFDKNED